MGALTDLRFALRRLRWAPGLAIRAVCRFTDTGRLSRRRVRTCKGDSERPGAGAGASDEVRRR